ncbi:MAG: PAS domain S-box-containing protein [Luteibaculaceae bacterium]|jgi:PAS domain S-box-containing protein
MDYFLDNIRHNPSGVLPKILVVDDKVANLVALRKVLKNVKAEVLECMDGNSALKLMLEHDIALALLDVQMPDMDGYELAEIMRSDTRTANIPIVFISAIFTSKLNVFKGFELGAFSFITKPFEPLELLNKVDFFLEKYLTTKAYDNSRDKFMELYNNSPDMLLSVDFESSQVVECNTTLLKITGYSKDEIVHQSIFNICDQAVIEDAKNALLKNGDDTKSVSKTFIITTKEGLEIDVQLKAEAVKMLDGKIGSYNLSLRDISELTKTKNQLQKTLFDLENFHEELKRFVYLTSHDLQEPLVTLESFLGLFSDAIYPNLDKNGKTYIQYCLTATGRMKEMVTALLDYSRLGQIQNNEKTDIHSLVQEVNRHLQGSILNKKAEIKIGNFPTLFINPGEISHLFQNLISNALKFSNPGVQPAIELNSVLYGENWEFSVQDNGIGIAKNQIGKLFQMFRQLHQRGEYEGMGIGLSMCKKIVEKYNGKIWIESELNAGTTIFFTLPNSLTSEPV